ncbi:hypothetical protein L3V82_07670 [Thiotrichales bacterium 19S3-7]|nr:hypothetical protein [Thiotrichales bacterium 19S3-7]MCF6802036.1 hypothetical protein [Thiotrichales bacterium 19S3-11]
MNIINKKYLITVFISFFLSMGISYADSYYKTTLQNDSDYTVHVKLWSFECMTYVKGLPLDIKPHSSKQIELRDNGNESSSTISYGENDGTSTNSYDQIKDGVSNGSIKNSEKGKCEGKGKAVTLAYQFEDEYGNTIDSSTDKPDLIKWEHEKGHPDSGDWYSNISPTTLGEDSNEFIGRLLLVNATCKGHDCHDKWYEHGGDADLFIETADADYFKTIGLGAVRVTDGVGRSVNLNEVNLDSMDETYLFHFSKTLETCQYIDKMIKCNNGVGSSFRSESLVFFCRQAYPSDASCPWASVSDSVNYANVVVNIY